NTNPISRLRNAASRADDMVFTSRSTPSMVMSPPDGASSMPRMCSSVDLPAPDAPTTDAISPGRSSKSSPRSTGIRRPPWMKLLVNPRTTTCAPPRARTAPPLGAAGGAAASVAAGGAGSIGGENVVGAPAGVNERDLTTSVGTRPTYGRLPEPYERRPRSGPPRAESFVPETFDGLHPGRQVHGVDGGQAAQGEGRQADQADLPAAHHDRQLLDVIDVRVQGEPE